MLLIAIAGGRAIYSRITAPPSCGELVFGVNRTLVSGPVGAEGCFVKAVAHCIRQSLTVHLNGVDTSATHYFEVSPQHDGCRITDSVEGHGCCFAFFGSREDYTCSRLVEVPLGLELQGCGQEFDYSVERPLMPKVSPSPAA